MVNESGETGKGKRMEGREGEVKKGAVSGALMWCGVLADLEGGEGRKVASEVVCLRQGRRDGVNEKTFVYNWRPVKSGEE